MKVLIDGPLRPKRPARGVCAEPCMTLNQVNVCHGGVAGFRPHGSLCQQGDIGVNVLQDALLMCSCQKAGSRHTGVAA